MTPRPFDVCGQLVHLEFLREMNNHPAGKRSSRGWYSKNLTTFRLLHFSIAFWSTTTYLAKYNIGLLHAPGRCNVGMCIATESSVKMVLGQTFETKTWNFPRKVLLSPYLLAHDAIIYEFPGGRLLHAARRQGKANVGLQGYV